MTDRYTDGSLASLPSILLHRFRTVETVAGHCATSATTKYQHLSIFRCAMAAMRRRLNQPNHLRYASTEIAYQTIALMSLLH